MCGAPTTSAREAYKLRACTTHIRTHAQNTSVLYRPRGRKKVKRDPRGREGSLFDSSTWLAHERAGFKFGASRPEGRERERLGEERKKDTR